MRAVLPLLLTHLGCAGGDAAPTSPVSLTPAECAAVPSEDDCAGTEGCAPEHGTACDGSGPVYAGCVPSNDDCADAEIVCAPDGTPDGCVFFNSRCFEGSSCAPGWSECAGACDLGG